MFRLLYHYQPYVLQYCWKENMMSDQLAYGHDKNDNDRPWKNIHLKTLTKTETICNKKHKWKYIQQTTQTSQIYKSLQSKFQGNRKVRRVSLCLLPMPMPMPMPMPVDFYFKTIASFSCPCWHLIVFFDILYRSRSVTNIKHYDPVSQYYSTKRSSMLPRQSTCCQSGRRRTS